MLNPPTAKRSHGVPVRQRSLQSSTPHFPVDSGTGAIDDHSVWFAGTLPRLHVTTFPDRLRRELILDYSEFPGQHEVEGLPVRNGVRAQVVRKVSQSLERDDYWRSGHAFGVSR